ncbi:MAG: [FeFe] hydrogenase H-cluster maturation GTPase HydF [Clostridiales bacterium]|nr:[FeFe] hydrogenase H-cluster maturation GTPase HydF [Clostridiales bacterium]
MGMNNTPSGERIHIGFFGRRNAGKSSLVNAVTGQELAVVSEQKGTTTDPVWKAMELLPLGPVVIIDTPGFDDEGSLGELRVKKTRQVLNRTDIAVLVVDAVEGAGSCDEELTALFRQKQIPYIVAVNKTDAGAASEKASAACEGLWADKAAAVIAVSALKGQGIHELKEAIGSLAASQEDGKRLLGDLVRPGDFVVLVVPIDSAAPKGRLILPQQQAIRDLLEAGAVSIVVKESELQETLARLGVKPAMVVTDSQAFEEVARIVPEDITLTSFSILMARYKGLLHMAVQGVTAIDKLKDGDRVLISEGCTHHRQCDDIGTVKIPRWLHKYTGRELVIETSSGMGFPEDLSPYAMVIHCGGCMLNEREVRCRMQCAADAGVPITNYGTAIAYMKGILGRSIELFPDLIC